MSLGVGIRRREFIAGTGAALAWSKVSRSQQTMPVVGFFSTRSFTDAGSYLSAFRAGLQELGYREGQNIQIEPRFGDGRYEVMPHLAEQLVALKVDLIVAVGSPAVRAAQQATATIPIVIGGTGDAVQSGLVASLARPGGNTTGLSNLATDITTKHLDLILTLLPSLSRLAVLMNPGSSTRTAVLKRVEDAGQARGVALLPFDVRNSVELDRSFAMMKRDRAEALIVVADGFLVSQLRSIAVLASQYLLPSTFDRREFPAAGGLLSYGPNYNENLRRAATYVDKILKGAKPADLPVEQPTKFELVINLTTAKALGLEIPAKLLFTADEVIE